MEDKKPNTTLPKNTKVSGWPWHIKLIKGKSNKEDCVGETKGDMHLFEIDADVDNSRKWRTFLHEYVHGILHMNGLGNVLTEEVEEVIAQSMEYGITYFIQTYAAQFNEATSGDRHE